MKSVSFDKTFESLKAQASKASNMLDRYDAIAAMETIDIERKRDFLISYYNTLDKSAFYTLKTEIIKQLSQDDNKQSLAVIKLALSDADNKVRKSVLDHMKTLPQELLHEVEKLLKDPSYEIIANVLEYLSFANPEKISFYLEQTKDVEGSPGRNVKIKWLEIASLTNEKYMDQLVSFTSNAYESRTRVNAINSLKKLNYLDANEIEYLMDAMLNPNTRTSALVRAVGNLVCWGLDSHRLSSINDSMRRVRKKEAAKAAIDVAGGIGSAADTAWAAAPVRSRRVD